MKVLDLFQCLFWGVGIALPPLLGVYAGHTAKVQGDWIGAMFFMFIAQVAVMVCVWKAST